MRKKHGLQVELPRRRDTSALRFVGRVSRQSAPQLFVRIMESLFAVLVKRQRSTRAIPMKRTTSFCKAFESIAQLDKGMTGTAADAWESMRAVKR